MLDSRALEVIAASPSIWMIGALSFALILQRYFSLPPKPKFPAAEMDEKDWHGSMQRAKSKFQNKTFLFGRQKEMIILPNYLFEELKDLPDNRLSFRKQVRKQLLGDYTGLGDVVPPLAESVKSELTMNINTTLALLQDEIQYAVEEGIGNCLEWAPVSVFGKLLRIVALVSGRIFVGRPLCRDEEFINLAVNYTVDCSKAVSEVLSMHPLARPFLTRFSPAVRTAQSYRYKLAAKLRPHLKDLLQAAEKMEKVDDENYAEFDPSAECSLAVWSLRHYEPGVTPTADTLASTLLSATFAAIHTTTMTLTHVLFDLAAHPEYQTVLREEIERVVAGEPRGRLRKKTMPKLRLMDSFIKESQRMNPLGAALLMRVVTDRKGITLSNGDYLPYNSVICVPAARHTGALDPRYLSPQPPQPSLDEFHPWRFSDLRTHPGEENKHQFVTTTAESTVFGHGIWACPGRFFAANEIKSILIKLLQRYDFALGPQGQGAGGEFKRPETHVVEMGYYPDMKAVLYFKDRTA